MNIAQIPPGHTAEVTTHGKKRRWIYPKVIKGKLYHYRVLVGYTLLGLLFTGPFIRINGEQLFLFNIPERKFVFFGLVFLPQDFYIFVVGMLTFMVFIALFTVVLGRIWCGWACPQTIFMEIIFRPIEYWIEGDHLQQKKLDAAPLSFTKVAKKAARHGIFLLVSFLIANIFLAYIIGAGSLIKIIREPVTAHIAGLSFLLLFTLVFHLVFARLRELVCTVICPYGRLQSVLLDNKSIQVMYDDVRGEPRGKRKRNSETPTGDCINCGLCVDVCPTGIDIRNGSQPECINCTACIDACDMVMKKLDRQPRLIGFKTEEQVTGRKPLRISKRVYAYSAVLGVLLISTAFLIIRRSDIETSVYRASGTLYQELPGSMISNLYTAELVNKTTHAVRFNIAADDPAVSIRYVNKQTAIARDGSVKLTFFLVRRQNELQDYKSEIRLNIFSNGKRIDQVRTTFIAPYKTY
ncbi:cytochrome c oxidase accessory protein CcoG [Hufsiella ginkgonis]|uniref:Cytochrome c oxidase accessory protein CcoG n=1 Tax=Hufsiella ginkgonis TaxID=2695274 RepID=A0A7K1Y0I8_9SPHI|nr:cytochrome c oxidase accessory protein CcoG [Hufsiella ginkgonis]MXV16745.1 cytochrome c oxidase accessory protein CcoG [Hufsiella ginkgonis]